MSNMLTGLTQEKILPTSHTSQRERRKSMSMVNLTENTGVACKPAVKTGPDPPFSCMRVPWQERFQPFSGFSRAHAKIPPRKAKSLRAIHTALLGRGGYFFVSPQRSAWETSPLDRRHHRQTRVSGRTAWRWIKLHLTPSREEQKNNTHTKNSEKIGQTPTQLLYS